MLVYVVSLFLFASNKICQCLENAPQPGVYWSGNSGNQNFFEHSSNTELKEDIKRIKAIMPDRVSENDPQSESDQFLQTTVNKEYASLITNLALENKQAFDESTNAIRRALEAAFLNTAGVVDTTFVDGVMNMIKREVDLKRQRNIYPYH